MPYLTITTPLCQAVADHITAQAGTYRETVTVERVNLPVDDVESLPDTGAPLVTVFPGVRRLAPDDQYRDSRGREYRVAVAVRAKMPRTLSAADRKTREDQLIQLGEEIEQSLEETIFAIGAERLAYIESEGTAGGDTLPFIAQHLEKQNQFTSAIAAVYLHV